MSEPLMLLQKLRKSSVELGGVKITIKDVVKFYKTVDPNAEVHYLSKFSGNLKIISDLASKYLRYFREFNPKGLKKEAEKQGLTDLVKLIERERRPTKWDAETLQE